MDLNIKFAKKIVVAVALSTDTERTLKLLRGMDFLAHTELHFVHVFNSITYASGIMGYPLVFPIKEDRELIEQSVLATLSKISQSVLPINFDGKVIQRCLFGESPKDKFCSYVDEVKADLVIVSTRMKRGMFESSFAQFVNNHTHASVMFLKDHN